MATRLRWAANSSVDPRYLEALQDPEPDPEPVRLVARMHVGSSRSAPAAWRMVAERLDGRICLICVGSSPGAARAVARQRARVGEVPPDAVAVRLQRWVRTATGGRWNNED